MSTQNREQSRRERLQEARAEKIRKQRNQRIWLIVGIVIVLGAVVAAGSWYSGGGSTTASTATPKVVATSSSIVMGNDPKAPVKVTIYEDFLCPYCRELEMETRDVLRADALKGKVLVEYRPIDILTQTNYSARTMNAWAAVLKHGTAKQALKLHDLFYDQQPPEQSAGQVSDTQIADWVKEVVGDSAAVTAAMGSVDTAFFTEAQSAMAAAKVQGTPTVFVNGRQLQATSMSDLAAQIETAIDNGGR